MKQKTKQIIKAILTVLIRIATSIFKKKGLLISLAVVSIVCLFSCVNGQMVVIKTPSSGITIHADSTGILDVTLTSDTIKSVK